jgi:single-strand DNA-binding protein
MAGSVNKVILIGNLGRDPEIRALQDGNKVVNLNVATTETWKDKSSGERQERTEWHKVVIFNDRIAETAERYLKKGSRIYVEGQLQTRKWTDKDGHDRYTTEVNIGRFNGQLTMLDGPASGDSRAASNGGGTGYAPRERAAAAPARSAGPSWDAPKGGDLDDEIPF